MRGKQLLREHIGLFLVLLIFTILTLYSSANLPLGEAADETDHYQYLRFVARSGRPPLSKAERTEAGFKGGLAPFYYLLTAWPIALVGEDSTPDIRLVDARPERYIPTDGLGINHLLHTLDEQWVWRGQSLAWHLVRLLSLPLGWVTIIATYALSRLLSPEQKVVAIGAAIFVAFLPRFVISSAVINDDNLVFALTALLLLTQVAIIQGRHSPKMFALFGLLFGLALVTKYFSLILIPETVFTLFIYYRAKKKSGTLQLMAFAAALFVTAAPWFIFITLRFNRIAELGFIPGLAASLGEPQITDGLVNLLSGRSVSHPAAVYTFPEWLALLYRSFWFEYGWMRIFAPDWVYALFSLLPLVAVLGLVRRRVRIDRAVGFRNKAVNLRPRRHFVKPARSCWVYICPQIRTGPINNAVKWLLGLHLSLFVMVVIVRYILSATIDTGQGRHLYSALPVIAFFISAGLVKVVKRISYNNVLYLLPAACYLILSAFTLYPSSFILPHYQTLPVTSSSSDLPISYNYNIKTEVGISLIGLNTVEKVTAGEALPVTLFWQADKEINKDYLVSLCLRDSADRPAACWRGHFVNGRYPARAWEAGDIVADTVFIPIPSCSAIQPATFHLYLELWPLLPDSVLPNTEEKPLFTEPFAQPQITIKASSTPTVTIDLWRAAQRLTEFADINLAETVSQITYLPRAEQADPFFGKREPSKKWLPLPRFDTPLYLPCNDSPVPLAILSHFVADPTLPDGLYHHSLAGVTLSLSARTRIFTPTQSALSFADYLAPLSVQISEQPVGNGLRMVTHDIPLPVTVRWQALRWMAEPLVISLKLLDKDFMVGGEYVASLGGRYPNLLWTPSEVVEESYPLTIKPDAPPGLYRLELSVVRQDKNLPDGFEYLPVVQEGSSNGHNLYPASFRLLDPAHNTPPSHIFEAELGDDIQLIGYDIASSGNIVFVALYWQSSAKIPVEYTVFTQLIGADGQVWSQWDNPPQAGRYPVTAWAENDMVVDRYSLTLRDGFPAGDYRLLVGMYDSTTGQRLPVVVAGQPQPDNAINLMVISLSPNNHSCSKIILDKALLFISCSDNLLINKLYYFYVSQKFFA